MGLSMQNRSFALHPADSRRPWHSPSRPSRKSFHTLLFTDHHFIDFVPAPHIVMEQQEPKDIKIQPNGLHSPNFNARVSYNGTSPVPLISEKTVGRHGVRVTALDSKDPTCLGSYTLVGKFDAMWWSNTTSPFTHSRSWFYVTSTTLPGQADVLWKQTASPQASTKTALPAVINRSTAQKKDDKEKKKQKDEERKKQQDEKRKNLQQKHQQQQNQQQQNPPRTNQA